ncbi:MAG: CvpA family protein [Gemmataceae bacterium]|nr:CvpA family protein [Gemmataceae bacterium]
MIALLSVAVIVAVAYVYLQEGLFTAATLFVNVILAGILTFNFYEPLADMLDGTFQRSFLAGYEDFIALVGLFSIFLAILRAIANHMTPLQVEYIGYMQQIGGGVFGALGGYLVAGFLVCALQTLPWHENFLGFQPRSPSDAGYRSYFPPDRVWLAMMRYAGVYPLSWKTDDSGAEDAYERQLTFDRGATFELRFLRYRRYGDQRQPLTYSREFDKELNRSQ